MNRYFVWIEIECLGAGRVEDFGPKLMDTEHYARASEFARDVLISSGIVDEEFAQPGMFEVYACIEKAGEDDEYKNIYRRRLGLFSTFVDAQRFVDCRLVPLARK